MTPEHQHISIELIEKLAADFKYFAEVQPDILPDQLTYQLTDSCPDPVLSRCRFAAFQKYVEQGQIVKQAFDTRKIDQQTERNPRGNLQYYHRSQAFIDEADAIRLENFKKLLEPLNNIKNKYAREPEYLNSYAKTLLETLENTLKVREGHFDVFKPQAEYLSQLLFLRYRLGFDELSKLSTSDLEKRILERDEALLKRGTVVQSLSAPVLKTGDQPLPENLIQALFQAPTRKPGEKTVERTITITIKENVID
jgi:hypothetical protein